jgi:dipeptidyl aminopeptidase/acylaminoacyl peptidase
MRKIYPLIGVSILVGLVLVYSSPSAAQPQRGLLPTDLSIIKDAGDVQISPDGSRVVYVLGESTPDRSRTISRLWIVPAAGGESKRLTTGEAGESTPRWSPDGKFIAFYSNRDGRDGLWIVPAEGGEPKLVTRVLRTNFYLKGAGESFAWAPDGKRIAFLSSPEVFAEASSAPASAPADPKLAGLPAQVLRPLTGEEIEKLPVEIREMIFRAQGQAMGRTAKTPIENALSVLPDDPRVITRIQYKSRTSFSDNLQSHIFVVDIETRRLRQITSGLFYDHSINWSPRGDEIVFVSNHEPDPDRVNNTDLFTVNVDNFAVRRLTKTKGCEWMPVFSPDGNDIAYLGTKREVTTIDSVAEDSHVYLRSARGGQSHELNRDLDRRATIVKWHPNGKLLLFLAGDHGKTRIYTVTKDGQLSPPRESNEQISGFSISRTGVVALARSTYDRPNEVFLEELPPQSPANSGVKRLTKINDAAFNQFRLSEPRDFRFRNDELLIQGWLVPPINLDENKKYPVVLLIHGGPHGMFGYGFNPTVQTLAAHGYAVLLINPRGSSGYGQRFADGCLNDWGGGDYRDLMKGVDEALARFTFLDKDRMGVTGGSYGGYMTNWVITQTDRFKAAVALASLSNLISFYSTSLYQDLIHAEFNGYPWDNFDILWDRSPLKHIKRAKTPLLLIHGEQDNDVHITQAEEMFTALRMRGIDSVFVRYPREGHGFRELRHREDSLARTLQWFDRYLKN